jgi:hypothetical protein
MNPDTCNLSIRDLQAFGVGCFDICKACQKMGAFHKNDLSRDPVHVRHNDTAAGSGHKETHNNFPDDDIISVSSSSEGDQSCSSITLAGDHSTVTLSGSDL